MYQVCPAQPGAFSEPQASALATYEVSVGSCSEGVQVVAWPYRSGREVKPGCRAADGMAMLLPLFIVDPDGGRADDGRKNTQPTTGWRSAITVTVVLALWLAWLVALVALRLTV
jgi:hypothetical protein